MREGAGHVTCGGGHMSEVCLWCVNCVNPLPAAISADTLEVSSGLDTSMESIEKMWSRFEYVFHLPHHNNCMK